MDSGPNLDILMNDKGFNIDIDVDMKTGFIFGGNQFNCGTWMDKMGASEKAANKGIPATPRDGAAIEIVSLLASTLQWIIDDNILQVDGIPVKDESFFTFKMWLSNITENFEKHFYIPLTKESDDQINEYISDELIKHRGIYKDTLNATFQRGDYHLRPNMIIAIATSPWLFDFDHAFGALNIAEKLLLGPRNANPLHQMIHNTIHIMTMEMIMKILMLLMDLIIIKGQNGFG